MRVLVLALFLALACAVDEVTVTLVNDTPDRCAAADSCDTCMESGYTDYMGMFEPCAWCGDSCETKSRAACARPQDQCIPEGGSAVTCSDLGWTVAPGRTVCASSKIDGKCSFLMSYDHAKQWCEEAGARLCTGEELSSDVALGTGCKLDSGRSWTSDTCISGHKSQAGSKAGLKVEHASCDDDSQKHFARCCANEPKGAAMHPPQRRKSCTQLGWKSGKGGKGVCANSVIRGTCVTAADFETAQSTCWSVGARLCSQNELENNEAMGTGCKLDNAVVWSSTPCEGGVMGVMGAHGPRRRSTPAECKPLPEALGVRCCSDFDAGTAPVTRSCEQLGWAVVPDFGKCADSSPSGICSGPVVLAEADRFCSNVGAHVCSREELELGVAANTGCKLNTARVWTTSECEGGRMSAAGHTAYFESTPPECTPADTELPVRCCANSEFPGTSQRGR